jgi:trans-aconitate methyltransferase
VENEFAEMAAYYDELYVKPEVYQKEAGKIISLIDKYKLSDGNDLLDLACGTGGHIPYWPGTYSVTGLDISPEMLAVARHKFPDTEFHQADLADFNLGKHFDVLVCLWGSIGFVRTQERLNRALITFAAHLKSGGILCMPPWSTQEEFEPKIVVESVKHAGVSLVRMENVKRKTTGLVEVDFHHLIGRDDKVTYHQQSIEIGLFSQQQYRNAIDEAGLDLVEDYPGPEVRFGAYIARKPLSPN